MNRISMTVAAVLLTGLGAGVATGTPAGARAARAEEHCVVVVTGQRESGEMLTSDPRCYPTFDQAMTAEGVSAWGDGASAQATSSFTIGTHYDGFNFTGSSMTVVGDDCAGGWLNVTASWNNRISSTRNGCPRIRHYAGYNLTGASETLLYPGGNLLELNNQTSSIQYLT